MQIETQKVKREKMLMEKERRRKLAAFEKMKEVRCYICMLTPLNNLLFF